MKVGTLVKNDALGRQCQAVCWQHGFMQSQQERVSGFNVQSLRLTYKIVAIETCWPPFLPLYSPTQSTTSHPATLPPPLLRPRANWPEDSMKRH